MTSNDTPERPMNTVVVGGSISGLMCAVVLQSAGHNVTVLERHHATDFKDHGAGMGMRPEVADFLSTYIKTATPVVESSNAAAYTLVDSEGTVQGVFPLPAKTRGTSWREIVRVLTETFESNAASQTSTKSSYKFACNVSSIIEKGKDICITYQHSERKGAEPVAEVIENIDLIIGADGADSTVRRLMIGDMKRSEPGYIVTRAMSVEANASSATRNLYNETAVVQCGPGRASISYAVPARDSSKGPKDLYLLQYRRYDDEQLSTIFTDVNGKKHLHAVPQDNLSEAADTLLRNDMATFLAPQLREIVNGCDTLLVQTAADLSLSRRAFFGGKVLLVGDAGGLPRPHVFAGTSKAAFDSLKLRELLAGAIDVEKWEQVTMTYANTCIDASIEMGNILLDAGDEVAVERFKRQGMVLVKQSAACATLRVQG